MIPKDTAITAENIGKRYRIGVKEKMEDGLLSYFLYLFKKPWENYKKYRSLYKFDDLDGTGKNDTKNEPDASDIFWALQNISFDIKKGERVGIIGSNGAGKSTLLKILCRITDPTCGTAKIRGQVTSLLEVGTGFHQELTGRENVYLNGSILGMSKQEMDGKFDQIVDFSGVDKFIDTPVKRYSSGMKVRLAFSVAAHLDPEVLIVDEVLAVGDADFQKKCINKMQDIGSQGRTILFVSHNMQAVTRLCSRAILIENGKIINDGPSSEVVHDYLTAGTGMTASREWKDPLKAPGGEVVRLKSVKVMDKTNQIAETIDIRTPVRIEMKYEVVKPDYILLPHFHLYNEEGIHAFVTMDIDPEWRGKQRPVGDYCSSVWIPGNFFSEGMMYVNAALGTVNPRKNQFYVQEVVAFNVVDTPHGDGARGDWVLSLGGVIRPLLDWQTTYSGTPE